MDPPAKNNLADYGQKLIEADKGQQIFFGFIFVGLIIKIGLGFAASASALLWGYFIIIFSIIGLVFLKIDPTKNNMSALKLLYQPLLLLVIILLWNISITLRFYDQINEKTVPSQYFMWSWFSTILITSIVVISILGYVANSEKSFTVYNYILLIFNFIVTAIQQIVLENFTVDGFKV
jgi:Na+/H+-translocating membrane pyrophosphatase